MNTLPPAVNDSPEPDHTIDRRIILQRTLALLAGAVATTVIAPESVAANSSKTRYLTMTGATVEYGRRTVYHTQSMALAANRVTIILTGCGTERHRAITSTDPAVIAFLRDIEAAREETRWRRGEDPV